MQPPRSSKDPPASSSAPRSMTSRWTFLRQRQCTHITVLSVSAAMGQSPSVPKTPQARDSNGPVHPSKALDDNISSDTSDVNSPNSKIHNPNLSAFRQTPPTDEESEAARQALERVRANTRRRSSDYDPTKDPLRAIPKDNQVEYSVGNAVKMIQLEEFKSLHEKPCVRNGLLTGIGTGAAVGGIAGVVGSMLQRSSTEATRLVG